MKTKIILMLLSLIFAVSCVEIEQEHIDLHNKLFKFEVEVLSAPDTSPDSPADIPYEEGLFDVELKVTALDFYGKKITDIKDNIKIYTSTGACEPSRIFASDFTDGEARITVSLLKTFDASFIVVEDTSNGIIGVSVEKDNNEELVDKKFFFKGLDIYDIQLPSNNTVNAKTFFNDSYVRISQNTDSDGSNPHNNLMVIHASGSGMYIIDTDRLHIDGNGDSTGACMIKNNSGDWVKNPDFIGYSTMYVYSRNAPINYDGDTSVGAGNEDFKYLRSGHKLDWFSGNLVEFPPGVPNGMTEMGFPIWQMISGEMDLDDDTLDLRMKDVPVCEFEHSDFVEGRNDVTNIKKMERYESNIVEIKDVEIGVFDADNKDYKIYSQWQVYPIGTDITVSDKPTFRVVSISGASEFDLLFHQKRDLTCKDEWCSKDEDLCINDGGESGEFECTGSDVPTDKECDEKLKDFMCKDNGCNENLCERVLHEGVEIAEIKGILHHVYSDIWVIYLRSKCDIKLKDDELGGWNEMIKNDPECKKQ